MLILLGAIWGGSFFFARIAVAEIPPLTLVLLRVAIAGAALHLYLLARGPSFALALPHLPMLSSLLALLNNVIPFSLIFAGQTALGAGLASVLNATTPFWTIIIANALTSDEKLSWNKVAGMLLGIAGTAVMIGPGLIAGLGGPVWAKFALIGASLSYALGADGRAALQGRAAVDRRDRPAHRLDGDDDPGRAACQRHGRPVFGKPARLGGGVRPGAAVDRLRLSPLFHHRRARPAPPTPRWSR